MGTGSRGLARGSPVPRWCCKRAEPSAGVVMSAASRRSWAGRLERALRAPCLGASPASWRPETPGHRADRRCSGHDAGGV